MRLVSQLINGISRVAQKLFRHFNGTVISTFFVPLFLIWSFSLCLTSNEALLPGKPSITPASVKGGSSLKYCYKLPDFFE